MSNVARPERVPGKILAASSQSRRVLGHPTHRVAVLRRSNSIDGQRRLRLAHERQRVRAWTASAAHRPMIRGDDLGLPSRYRRSAACSAGPGTQHEQREVRRVDPDVIPDRLTFSSTRRGFDPSRSKRQSRCVPSASTRITENVLPSASRSGEYSLSGVCVSCVSASTRDRSDRCRSACRRGSTRTARRCHPAESSAGCRSPGLFEMLTAEPSAAAASRRCCRSIR